MPNSDHQKAAERYSTSEAEEGKQEKKGNREGESKIPKEVRFNIGEDKEADHQEKRKPSRGKMNKEEVVIKFSPDQWQ